MSTRTLLPAAVAPRSPSARPPVPRAGRRHRRRRTRRRAPRPGPHRDADAVVTGSPTRPARRTSCSATTVAGGFVPAGVPRRARAAVHPLRRRDASCSSSSNAAPPGGDIGHRPADPDRGPDRGADPVAARVRADRRRPRRPPGTSYHEPDGGRRPDRRVHDQRRRRHEDGLGDGAQHGEPQPNPTPVMQRLNGARATGSATSTRAAPSRATPYEPAAYRGVITDATGVQAVPVRDWPWTDLKPTDFTFPNDPNVLPQATAMLTPEQAAALGVEGCDERDHAAGSASATTPRSCTRSCSGRCCPTRRSRRRVGARRAVSSPRRSAPRRSSRTASGPS